MEFVHIGSLLPMQFSDELLTLSRASTDYILSVGFTQYGETTSTRLCVLPSRGIVVERYSVRVFAADCPLSQHLGFNHMLSSKFFLLSPRSRLPISRLRCRFTRFRGSPQFSFFVGIYEILYIPLSTSFPMLLQYSAGYHPHG